MAKSNGWRDGRDPVQRWLRILTALVCLAVFVYLAVREGAPDFPTLALAIGSVLLLLGYESVIRLPFLGKPDTAEEGREHDARVAAKREKGEDPS